MEILMMMLNQNTQLKNQPIQKIFMILLLCNHRLDCHQKINQPQFDSFGLLEEELYQDLAFSRTEKLTVEFI